MAVVVRINEAFTDTSLPVIPVTDPIESAGSVLLLDSARSISSAANGSRANNLLYRPDLVDVPYLGIVVNAPTSQMTAALTPKKGLKFSPVPYASVANSGGSIQLIDTKLFEYFHANGHAVYASVWGRVTRAYSTTDPATLAAASFNAVSMAGFGSAVVGEAYWWAMIDSWGKPVEIAINAASGTATNRTSSSSLKNIGPISVQVSFITDPNMTPTLVVLEKSCAFSAGGLGIYNTNTLGQAGIPAIISMPEVVFYRFYVEDLYLSGRTYAEVKALDDALYAAQVLTPGGKYYE